MYRPAELEIEELESRFGVPLAHSAMLPANHTYISSADDSRKREVLMVIRRPNGRLLAMTKPAYPNGVFRLPTGGVNHAEPILAALRREVAEETSLEVEVTRFLAYIQYRIEGLASGQDQPHFETFAFLLEEVGGDLRPTDPEEPMEFKEVDVSSLLEQAHTLVSLEDEESPDLGDTWASWGHFRAIGQRLVHRALLSIAAESA